MKTEEKPEMVKVDVALQKEVYEFLKAAHSFAKWKEPLEEYLGYQIVYALQGDFTDNLAPLLNMKEIVQGYGLDKVSDLKVDC
jgi:hypothetical protein